MSKFISILLICAFLFISISTLEFSYQEYYKTKTTGYIKVRIYYKYSYSKESSRYYTITKGASWYTNSNYSDDNKVTLTLQKKIAGLCVCRSGTSKTTKDKDVNKFAYNYPNKTYKTGSKLRIKANWKLCNPSKTYKAYSGIKIPDYIKY